MAFLVFILMLVFMFKLSVFTLRLFGKLVGGIFSLLFHLTVGLLGIVLFGTAALFLPILLVMGSVFLISGTSSNNYV